MDKKQCYYKAYDERYKIIHARNHTWAAGFPTPMVAQVLEKYGISKRTPILEIGCGEGRDSIAVLQKGYSLLASDVSPEAVRFCKEQYPEFRNCFQVIDACTDRLAGCYDFIFATSVLHMLVKNQDRHAFYAFFHHHLTDTGKGLILTMGDGMTEFCTDANTAYDLQERSNNAAHIPVVVPNTSCRMVSFSTLEQEINNANLRILESGLTQSLPDFSSLMYLVVTK